MSLELFFFLTGQRGFFLTWLGGVLEVLSQAAGDRVYTAVEKAATHVADLYGKTKRPSF